MAESEPHPRARLALHGAGARIKTLARALAKLPWRTARGALWRGLAALALVALLALASMRWIDPNTSAVIARENRAEENSGAPASLRWRDLEKISRHLAVAVIASEDQRFFEHFGMDFTELSKSLSSRTGRLRGASTISQQVVKNLLLWRERSYLRKIIEAPLAFYIDMVWGKRRVLEVYLNIVQFGPRLYGAENASRHYFGKPASRLTRYESARLASVLPNPKARSPLRYDEESRARQRHILRQMRAIGGVGVLKGM